MTAAAMVEAPVDVRAELSTAEKEHADAHAAWVQLAQRQEAVERFGVLPDEVPDEVPAARTRTPRAISSSKPRGRKIDAAEAEVVLDDLRARKAKAAAALIAARDRLAAAKVAKVAAELPTLAAEHEQAAAALVRARDAAEAALVEVEARGIVLLEVAAAEQVAANRLRQAALNGAATKDAREAIVTLTEQRGPLPVDLDDEGHVSGEQERPSVELFRLGANRWRVDHADFGDDIVRTIRNGRRRLGDVHDSVNERVVARIQRRLEQLDREREA